MNFKDDWRAWVSGSRGHKDRVASLVKQARSMTKATSSRRRKEPAEGPPPHLTALEPIDFGRYALYLRTSRSHILKSWVEGLKYLLQEGSIVFSPSKEDGSEEGSMTLASTNTSETVFVYSKLHSHLFETWHCPAKVVVSLNFSMFHRYVVPESADLPDPTCFKGNSGLDGAGYLQSLYRERFVRQAADQNSEFDGPGEHLHDTIAGAAGLQPQHTGALVLPAFHFGFRVSPEQDAAGLGAHFRLLRFFHRVLGHPHPDFGFGEQQTGTQRAGLYSAHFRALGTNWVTFVKNPASKL